jgi:hypothetical protein
MALGGVGAPPFAQAAPPFFTVGQRAEHEA